MSRDDSSELLHTIRLHGPWELQPLARTRRLADGAIVEVAGDLPPACRQQIPADWSESLGADFRGRVRYGRSFGSPTGLSPHDRLHLVIERADAWAEVELNGEPFGKIPAGRQPWRADVTSRLRVRNRLVVTVYLPKADETGDPFRRGDRAGQPGGLIGPVRLEIRRPVE